MSTSEHEVRSCQNFEVGSSTHCAHVEQENVDATRLGGHGEEAQNRDSDAKDKVQYVERYGDSDAEQEKEKRATLIATRRAASRSKRTRWR